jgi:polyhydroxyalkanoate synthesis repressor PhaR
VVTIKRYGNRRLYDTTASRYVNLDEVAAMVRAGTEIRVVDAASSDDQTRDVLLQIVLDVLRGKDILPTPMLRRIIRASGDDPMQRMLREQMAASLNVMSNQLDQLEAMFAAVPKPPRPFQEPTYYTVSEPEGPRYNATSGPEDTEDEVEPPASKADPELDALRARLAQLEERLKPKPAPKKKR